MIQTDQERKTISYKPELDKIKERESLVTSLDIASSLNRSINGIKNWYI